MTVIVERKEDMSPTGCLRLFIQDDGDVVITVVEGEAGGLDDCPGRTASIEFCTPAGGGGGSKRTWRALRGLAQAMAEDNADARTQVRCGEFPGDELLPRNLGDYAAPATLQDLAAANLQDSYARQEQLARAITATATMAGDLGRACRLRLQGDGSNDLDGYAAFTEAKIREEFKRLFGFDVFRGRDI